MQGRTVRCVLPEHTALAGWWASAQPTRVTVAAPVAAVQVELVLLATLPLPLTQAVSVAPLLPTALQPLFLVALG